MSIDHLGLAVGDYDRGKAFYAAALAPLGMSLMMEVPPEVTGAAAAAGFGRERPFFWISGGDPTTPRLHVAFTADSREAVNNFYAAAIAAGAQDNGAPGLRPHYHPDYYAAFVLDPDGHNIEAVCHAPA